MSLDIPDSFEFTIGLDLDVGITTLPKINVGIDPLNIDIAPMEFKIAPMEFKIDPLEIKPIDLSFRIKEIPSVRMWFPTDYKVCLAIFGAELASIRLCGQAQVITEPYVANPCECRAARIAGNVAVVRDADPAMPVG
jgi:hypothetical protein